MTAILPASTFTGTTALYTVKRKRLLRIALTSALCITLIACKVVVIVPAGGKVVTEDGFECLGGQTCIVDVSDTSFDSTFTAIPDAGNTFTRWKKKSRYLCGGTTVPCRLSTSGFAGKAKPMAILASDDEFFLQPTFVDYDVAYWKNVLAEIDQGNFTTNNYLYATQPIVGQCDPGLLQQGPRSRALAALRQTRALHQLPDLDYDSSFDSQVQQSSLVSRANMRLNHSPDPGDNCYTQAAADGAATSNLSGGSRPTDPAEDIFGWTNDNNNLADLMKAGHRRWILFPQLGYTSYGQVEGYATLKVFSFGMASRHPVPAELDFVAMPYRYYPYVLVSQEPDPTPWSISMVPAGTMSSSFNYFANAQVSIKETDSGKSLTVSNIHKDNERFGLANFLSWMVEGWEYDVDYTVTISSISLPGGGTRNIEYPVTLDRYNLFSVNPPREGTDSKQGRTLQGRFNTPEDEDGYALRLSGNVSVTGQSEFSNWGFYVRVYNGDKQLVKSADQPFTKKFPPGSYSIIVSPCDENGLCYQGTQTYTVEFN